MFGITGFVNDWSHIKPSAPITVGSVLVAMFAAPAMWLFVAARELFVTLEFAKLMLLAAGLGAPVLSLAFGVYYVPTFLIRHSDLMKLAPNITGAQVVREDDALLWGALWTGSTLAASVFFVLSSIAYYTPTRLGSSLLLVCGLLGLRLLWKTVGALRLIVGLELRERMATGQWEIDTRSWHQRALAKWLLRAVQKLGDQLAPFAPQQRSQ